ncbi:calcium-binding protein [Sphingomonas sp. SUN039]|uniref:calcium-binding protein n=1 Tax=Sphingomonas sp. SUN039 TaxID=2937787 RepID=UPI002164A06A|nr:calcium-binding protein [Sphingomonas sp. SUN039]UVO54980.1 calcium-binding protein [Sphingomonas sp. SUN039]
MKIWQVVAVSVAAGVTLPALAQMAEGPVTRAEVEARVKDRLGRLDADKNGTVTRDEMMAFAKARMETHADDDFAAMDTDKNGSISRAEFDAARAKRGFPHVVRMERRGPNAMMAPPPPPEGAATPQPAPGPDGKPVLRERMRVKMMDGRSGIVMADGDGKGIVIADAVKKALDRFDAADTNKDGKLSPEELKAQRGTWRTKVS